VITLIGTTAMRAALGVAPGVLPDWAAP
jgi:hypothetical protein